MTYVGGGVVGVLGVLGVVGVVEVNGLDGYLFPGLPMAGSCTHGWQLK